MKDFVSRYLREIGQVIVALDRHAIEDMVTRLRKLQGRLFLLGVGGSAANASHAVNDFRKVAGIEAYAPTDNVGELTARINDDGWGTCFTEWLRVSRLSSEDMVMVFSVGGGSEAISANIFYAVDYAKSVGAQILGIVSRDGGHTAQVADVCVIIPSQSVDTITPLAESFQAVIWHLLVAGLAREGQA